MKQSEIRSMNIEEYQAIVDCEIDNFLAQGAERSEAIQYAIEKVIKELTYVI